MEIRHLDHPLSDRERAELLFQGDLLIFRNIDAMKELIDAADQLLRTELNGLEPVSAQHHLSREQFLEKAGRAQTAFRKDPAMRAIFFRALAQCGVDLSQACYDHFPMRIVPFSDSHNGALRAAIGHHRDTWGANIHSQQNWWAPIYPLEPERSIAFYPDYWQTPLANNTASWSFEDYLATRAETANERQVAYPSAPHPTELVDERNVLKMQLEPGDILCFSSAHLHASVVNSTDAARVSVEMRTVHLPDLTEHRQAPNVDNEADTPMYQWFKTIEGRIPLPQMLESTH